VMDYSKRQKIIQELALARLEIAAGKLSRRDFNRWLVGLAAAAGVSVAMVEEANAWVGTRMRKAKRAGSLSTSNLRSLRFDSARSTYLSRQPTATGNTQKFSFSTWFKRTKLSSSGALFSMGDSASTIFFGITLADLNFTGNGCIDRISVLDSSSGSIDCAVTTDMMFRDTSAWYHLTVAVDTTQPLSTERVIIYVNGTRVTTGALSTYNASIYPSLNFATAMNAGTGASYQHHIGKVSYGAYYFNGYQSEIYFVDGAALTPWSFVDIDPVTGQLVPKSYTGSYGVNGYYLPFNESTSGATLGYDRQLGPSDSSKNNFTVNAHAVTDQLLDVPTNNFCGFNPLDSDASAPLSEGALSFTINSTAQIFAARANHTLATGKWYWEMTNVVASPYFVECGIVDSNTSITAYASGTAYHVCWSQYASYDHTYETVYKSTAANTWAGMSSPSAAGDVLMVAFDADAGKLWFGKNGTWWNSSGAANPATGADPRFSGIDSTKSWKPYVGAYFSTYPVIVANFGQGGQSGVTYDSASGGSFKHTPPSGFKALSAGNLPTPAIAKPGQYFNAVTYSGNGGNQRIGSVIPSTQGYQVARSLRFNSADSAYLTRTPAGSGNQRIWTFSTWVKQSKFGGKNILLGCGPSVTNYGIFSFAAAAYLNGNDTLKFATVLSNSTQCSLETSAVYQNSSAWIHVVLSVDTTQAVASDRLKLYVDGTQVTSFTTATYPIQNLDLAYLNTTQAQNIGVIFDSYGYFDGYMTEINFIDAQALGPGSFGQTDATSGEWVPKAYGGTYGTNGFYLNFSDNSNTTAATLGKDYSPNGNNWTPNNFSVAAGAGIDSVTDSPTNYGTDSGGTTENSRGNYATWDTLRKGPNCTISNGALDVVSGLSNDNDNTVYCTQVVSSGKWYAEFQVQNTYSYSYLGICADPSYQVHHVGYLSTDCGLEVGTGALWSNSVSIGSHTGATAGQTIMIALDMDNGKAWWGRNGTWFASGNPAEGTGAHFSGITSQRVGFPRFVPGDFLILCHS